ncbi:phytanoyl-CoA dioxygenase family protein [Calycomorphotria hydatis]|uniref:Phytanoyl-CoA dioxygenase (PhyH) n=1 Tax=Calycomorphotria hydatis TaxID=2528027 RepID=A0A517T5J9_9PLAN|nr:phytanoyl-CoA dioxygenase family protein [Calycomorphotria hydatis]QDT63634.1 Phytanoyl-CoA dioxygenase (PhyH) [Calycomorphotria hydatis]
MSVSGDSEEEVSEGFSPEEVDRFRTDGYLVVPGAANGEIVERMRQITLDELGRAKEPIEYEADLQYPGAPLSMHDTGGRTARRLKFAYSRDFLFTEWVTSPVIRNRLVQILGSPFVMPLAHHNCIMTKQPHFSSDTGWHQDIRYWSYEKPELVSVWLALGKENRENGCLRVIPGTHTQTLEADRYDQDQFLREDDPRNDSLLDAAIDVELNAGDVLFFHARLFHSATRNYSTEPKFSVVFTFRPEDNRPLPGSRSASMPEMLVH